MDLRPLHSSKDTTRVQGGVVRGGPWPSPAMCSNHPAPCALSLNRAVCRARATEAALEREARIERAQDTVAAHARFLATAEAKLPSIEGAAAQLLAASITAIQQAHIFSLSEVQTDLLWSGKGFGWNGTHSPFRAPP